MDSSNFVSLPISRPNSNHAGAEASLIKKNDTSSKHPENSQYKITLLGIDISKFSQTNQFILVSGGVFFFFVIYGYLIVS